MVTICCLKLCSLSCWHWICAVFTPIDGINPMCWIPMKTGHFSWHIRWESWMGSGNLKSYFKAVRRGIIEIINVLAPGKAVEVDEKWPKEAQSSVKWEARGLTWWRFGVPSMTAPQVQPQGHVLSVTILTFWPKTILWIFQNTLRETGLEHLKRVLLQKK